MYAQLGGTLPLMTRVLIKVSNVCVKGAPFLIVLVIVGVFCFKKWLGTDKGRATWDGVLLRVPIVGGLVQKTALSRFSSSLSTLVSSGVPILEALEITAETVSNAVVARGVRSIADGARQGEPLTKPLADHPIFPPMLTQMMSIGEETGALDTLLRKAANFYEQEVEATVDALTSLLEPLLIMILGSAVGTMVIALYLPMFDIIKLVGNNN
jgi:type IV pilus assembly protein PilC